MPSDRNPRNQLNRLGQSLWPDFIDRSKCSGGILAREHRLAQPVDDFNCMAPKP
jgi:hypothetical protein